MRDLASRIAGLVLVSYPGGYFSSFLLGHHIKYLRTCLPASGVASAPAPAVLMLVGEEDEMVWTGTLRNIYAQIQTPKKVCFRRTRFLFSPHIGIHSSFLFCTPTACTQELVTFPKMNHFWHTDESVLVRAVHAFVAAQQRRRAEAQASPTTAGAAAAGPASLQQQDAAGEGSSKSTAAAGAGAHPLCSQSAAQLLTDNNLWVWALLLVYAVYRYVLPRLRAAL